MFFNYWSPILPGLKRVSNILRYGIGQRARERKQADKEAARQAAFHSDLWREEQGLAHRQYASYEEYLAHQSQKLEKVAHRLQETEAEDLAEFTRRFSSCTALSVTRSVLCLGARLGTEVKALRSLGYFAVGIDLNPGINNPYVLYGDFHNLMFADGAVDAVYTNALDHVFDLKRVVAEIKRLLSPGGLFIADVLLGFEEGFVPGAYEATHWPTVEALLDAIRDQSGFALESVRDLGYTRRDRWQQAVFRKPLSEASPTDTVPAM